MRYREFKLTEQQLNELRMGQSDLTKFAKSPAAQGIQAGFEAEMIFPGMAGEGETEPDYDEDIRPSSIDDVIEFFSYDGSGYGMGRSEANRLRSSLEEEFWEYNDEQLMSEFQDQAFTLVRDYIETHDFDFEEAVQEYLKDEAGLSDEEIEQVTLAAQGATSSTQTPAVYKEATAAAARKLDELAEESISSQDSTYDTVLDEFRDDYDSSDNESDWLRNNYEYMSSISDAFGVSWPYWRGTNDDEGYNEDNAEQLADDLSRALGVKTRASGGYHSSKRDDVTWIFEPDGSLSADDDEDMPVEIVSPPMDLQDCLTKLDEFFAWADTHNAYTNKSTGFHMGVSLPNVGGKVDFVKLALFLGDEYVLQAFGRQAIGYCESAIKKIKQRTKGRDESIESAMKLLRNSLIDVARELVASDQGFGKYTSINPKGNYIEFRSAGGQDYSKDIPKLKNTLLRYAQAMVVAADPQLERKEYYKKFYKLISPAGGNTALDLFARYTAGTITAEELKNQWATATLEKEKPSGESGKWEVFDEKTGEILFTVDAQSRGEAIEKGFESGDINWRNSPDARPVPAEPKPSRRLDLAKRIKGPTPPNFYIKNADTDEIVHLYNAANREQAHEMLKQYSSTHQGRFLFGETKYLKPDELAQARKNAAADTATQQPAATQPQQQQPQQQQAHADNGLPMWEIYQRSNNLPLHRFADHTQMTAWSAAGEWARNNGFHPQDLSLRPATTSDPVMPQV